MCVCANGYNDKVETKIVRCSTKNDNRKLCAVTREEEELKKNNKTSHRVTVAMAASNHFRLEHLFFLFTLIIIHECHGYAINETVYLTDYRTGRYGIDDLLSGQFTYKMSDDIDMDPCKAGKCAHNEYAHLPPPVPPPPPLLPSFEQL